MENMILIGIMIAVFVIGYFFMKKVDVFIYEVEMADYNEYQLREPSYIVISGDKPLMEIDSQIASFREKHDKMQIILCREELGNRMQEILAASC